MKKILFFLLMLLFNTTSCISNSIKQDLQEFAALSRRCLASAQSTDDEVSFNTFKKINNFYLDHRAEFKNIEALKPEDATKLAKECAQILTHALPITRGPHHEDLALVDAMNLFSHSTPHLLRDRTTSVFFARVILLTLVETIFFLAEDSLANGSQAPESKKEKHLPEISERFNALITVDIFSTFYAKLLGLNIAKAITVGGVNEYTPQGIPSYLHKLAETLLPKIAAVIASGVMKYNMEKLHSTKDKKKFAQAAIVKIISPFILGRGFLGKTHPLYKPMLALSCIFPFFAGTSSEFLDKEKDSLKLWKNILMDGISGYVLFNTVPQTVNKLIPKRNMKFNPTHRRKAIYNSFRAVFDTAYGMANKEAFSK